MEGKFWIRICTDERGLFTAELKDGAQLIESLGGSYPKVNYVCIDATRKWGKLPFKEPEVLAEEFPELPKIE